LAVQPSERTAERAVQIAELGASGDSTWLDTSVVRLEWMAHLSLMDGFSWMRLTLNGKMLVLVVVIALDMVTNNGYFDNLFNCLDVWNRHMLFDSRDMWNVNLSDMGHVDNLFNSFDNWYIHVLLDM